MLIKVTQNHIEEAKTLLTNNLRADCCPVALAVSEAMGERYICGMENVCNDVGMIIIKLPEEAQEFIQQFDKGYEVEPFEFDLTV